MSFSNKFSQKFLLCKKMNTDCNDINCPRSHSVEELIITNCIHGYNCKKQNCPYVHPYDKNLTKKEYFERMYNYISPYESYKTSICRYYKLGCKIQNCRKAHSSNELVISKCDCYREEECSFYHENRDKNITREQYFDRMKTFSKIIKKSDKNLLCRYINIGCQRKDCPYAHSIDELTVHKCIFKNCKKGCIFIHNNENINKKEYFERMLKHIQPFKPKNILCHIKNCDNYKCKYAHDYSDVNIPNCIRENLCKKHCCPFIHPSENLSKTVYYNRMLISKYPN